MKTISAALNAARRQGFIPQNPAEAIESLKHTAESKHPFTEEQIGALVNAAPGDWRGAILFAYFTGPLLSMSENKTAMNVPRLELAFRSPASTLDTRTRIVFPV